LTVKGGVVIKLAANQSIFVDGALVTEGTLGQEVVITSIEDDDYGGDTMGDGVTPILAADHWSRVEFRANSDTAGSQLAHTVIRYGGQGNNGNIYLNNADLPITSCWIYDSSTYGIRSYYSSPAIVDSIIEDNSWDGIRLQHTSSPQVSGSTIRNNSNGIYVEGTVLPILNDNTIDINSGYGIYFSSNPAAVEITGNTITGNNKPVQLPFSALPDPASGNDLTGNTIDQIEVRGNTLGRALNLTSDMPYYLVTGTATVATGVKLSAAPGTIWKFATNSRLDINGALHAEGTAGQPIHFTSYRDDSVGGDTNGDGPSSGSPGDWDRIQFNDSVVDFLCNLEHTVVRYGGSGNQGNVYMYLANVPVLNSEFSNGSSYGLYLYGSSPIVTSSRFENNCHYGIRHYS